MEYNYDIPMLEANFVTTEQGTGIFDNDTGGSTVNTATGEPESAADQMKSVYEDILHYFNRHLV